MLSQQEISDRFEIQNLLVDYCNAIDGRKWALLDSIFTHDAIIDYTEAGGAKGTLADIKAYLEKALKPFSSMQHMLGLPSISIDGDIATARTAVYNPMVIPQKGQPHVFFVGLWYCDELIRTDEGWRISKRSEEVSHFHNLPDGFAAIEP